MRQKVLGFDQEAALSFKNKIEKDGKTSVKKLDIIDLALIAFMNEELRDSNNVFYSFDDKSCISYNPSKIVSEFPILGLDCHAVRMRVKKIKDFEIIDVFTKNIEGLGTRAFYTYGEKANLLGMSNIVAGCTQEYNGVYPRVQGGVPNGTGGCTQNLPPKIANNNYNNYNNYNNQEQDKNNNAIKPLRAKRNWRKDYEDYKNIVNEAKVKILEDKDFEKSFLSMYPNGDFYRTIICNFDFWLSERGWEYKKKSKGEDINMVSTIKKNYTKNVIYKNPNDEPIKNLEMLNIGVNKDGKCEDGTFIRGAYRYYHSLKDNKDYSIPIKAPIMPNERCEFNYKTNTWYIPKENEVIYDFIW